MAEEESGEKSHEPSPRKLEQARKKGEIPRTPDLLTAMAYLGFLAGAATLGSSSLMGFGSALMPMLERPDKLRDQFFGGSAQPAAAQVISETLSPLFPMLIIPGCLVLLALFATRGIVFSGQKLTPKISRISPISNAKNKYGRGGLFEFLKSFVKLSIYSIVLVFFVRSRMDEIVGVSQGSPAEVVTLILSLVVKLLMIAVLIAIVIGGIDAIWQHSEHIRKNRMTLKELKDEMKDSEGDPHLKQHRRLKAQELALNQMIAEVPKADVIIVNPTHYAVALKWSRMAGSAPECVAKGVDEIALRIREAATDANVPIHSDPPTARALYATTEIGQEISPDHYEPVAAAIRFAQNMREKARQKRW